MIVDNSDDDAEYHALKNAVERADIVSIKSDRNGGFSYGTNIGIRHVLDRADAILILNPDTEVTPNFFQTLKEIQVALPDVVVSPHGIHMETRRVWSAGGRFYWIRGRADVLTAERRAGETEFGTCACLLLPKAAIKEVGYLDEDFFLGGEEWDLSLRLRQAGWPIIYAPRSRYLHEVSGTHEKYGLRFFYIGMRTKVLFARKHYGKWFWPWLICFLVPSAPMLLWRNSRLKHGNMTKLIPRLYLAVMRSARMQKITEREFSSEGMAI